MLGACQAPLCALARPLRTELGDQMSLRTGGLEVPQRKTRKPGRQLPWALNSAVPEAQPQAALGGGEGARAKSELQDPMRPRPITGP